jgi:hypothetical protein
MEIMDNWSELLDCGKDIDVIYLDFQKVFDTVTNLRLLNKLNIYDIRGI